MAVAEDIEGGFVGPYEIVSTLSEGRWGATYKARDTIADVFVSIKTLQIAVSGDESLEADVLGSFRKAGRKIGSIHHPSLTPLLEVGETETGVPYIVRAYVEGRSLRQIISSNTPLSPKETVHYLAQIADALDACSQKDVVHGDLKPRKIILDNTNRACLLDVGIHDVITDVLQVRRDYFSAPRYISPEHIKEKEVSASSDIFSLAVIGYELLTGYRPFPGSDFAKVVTAIVHNEPLSFADVGIPLGSEVEEVFAKALAKDPKQRHATALEFVSDLAQSLSLIVDGDGVVGGQKLDEEEEPEEIEEPDIEELGSDEELFSALESEEVKEEILVPPELELSLEDDHIEEEQRSYSVFVVFALGISILLLGFQLSFSGDESKPVSMLETVGDVSNLSSAFSPTVPEESFEDLIDSELESAINDFAEVDLDRLKLMIREAADRNSDTFTRIFINLLKHEDYSIRVEALKALGIRHHFTQPGSIQAIIGRLGDKDYIVRGFAVRVIARHRHPLALRALEQFKYSEKNPTVLSLMDKALQADSSSN